MALADFFLDLTPPPQSSEVKFHMRELEQYQDSGRITKKRDAKSIGVYPNPGRPQQGEVSAP